MLNKRGYSRKCGRNCARKYSRYCVVFAIAFFMAVGFLFAQDFLSGDAWLNIIREEDIRWYRSNSAGMILDAMPSRFAALDNEYALSIRAASRAEIPAIVLPHFNSAYRIELRTLYKEGEAIRYQWIFRDARGLTRVTAAGRGSIFAVRNSITLTPEEADAERTSGIIEIRNSEGDVIREFQYNEDRSEWDFRYQHRDSVLIRVDIWFKAPPAEAEYPMEPEPSVFVQMFTDLYRYTRTGSLRAVDRTFHQGATDGLRIAFPRVGPGAPLGNDLISQGGVHSTEYFAGAEIAEGATISHNVDSRGRILSEIWRDEDGQVLGELINTWSGDRLVAVLWRSDEDERLIEFEHDTEGNRIVERNFRNGVLERSVTAQAGMEIEEIFMNGRLVLRAHWENGVKISEERISPARGRQ